MINVKNTNVYSTIDLQIPLAYEYDTETQSIVLLDGYLYVVYYNNDSREYREMVDLRQNINLPPIIG